MCVLVNLLVFFFSSLVFILFLVGLVFFSFNYYIYLNWTDVLKY